MPILFEILIIINALALALSPVLFICHQDIWIDSTIFGKIIFVIIGIIISPTILLFCIVFGTSVILHKLMFKK